MHATIAGQNLFYSIIESEEKFNLFLNANAKVQFSVRVQDFEAENFKFHAMTAHTNPDNNITHYYGEGPEKANVFVIGGFNPRPGLSGMPFVEARDGLLYVAGMLVSGAVGEFGTFVPAHVINSMILPPSLVDQSCDRILVQDAFQKK